MLAHAFLSVITAAERIQHPIPGGLIVVTVKEFRRLFDAIRNTACRDLATVLARPLWRRRHQARAR